MDNQNQKSGQQGQDDKQNQGGQQGGSQKPEPGPSPHSAHPPAPLAQRRGRAEPAIGLQPSCFPVGD